VSFRYNFGTGFPFTATQGFYARENFEEGVNTETTTNNPGLGILFSPDRNGNRLPNYHRADISARKTFEFRGRTGLELTASVTNTLNRENIFFISRIDNARVDQLPIIPSLGATFKW
jgi:TonB dependent receptor.